MKPSKQRASLDVHKFSFNQRVVQECNKLPQEVMDATSVVNVLGVFWATYYIGNISWDIPGGRGAPAIVQTCKHMQYIHMKEAQGCVWGYHVKQ